MPAPRTRRSRFAALAALLAASFTLASAGTSLAAAPTADDRLLPPVGTCANELDLTATRGAQREAMRCLVNHVRTNAGLPQLKVDPILWWSAIDKAYDIVECRDFRHEACGRSTSYWALYEGYGQDIAENIAYGPADWGTARATMNMWMQSPGHRANILDPRRKDFGVGMAQTTTFPGVEGWKTQVWVQHFGFGR
jgi:uncharacterized protein YkwD